MVLEKTLPLILIFLLGFFLKKKNILDNKDSDFVSKVLLYLVIPSVIIKSFASVTLETRLIFLPLSALFVVFLLTIFGYIFSRFLKLKNKTRSSFIVAFPTLQGGTIGYAFMLAGFGELGLSRFVLFDIANGFYVFTVVYFLSSYLGKNNVSMKRGLVKLLKTPIIWALFVGLFFGITRFQNTFLFNLFDIIGGSLLFLTMLFVGLEFKPSIPSFKLPFITILLKTATGLLLGWIASVLFGLGGIERIAVLVAASLPPSIVTLVFAKENDLDVEYSANLLSMALVFSILFTFLLINFL